MAFKKLWSDMHSNIHHSQIGELAKWYDQAKSTLDFWAIAYYSFRKLGRIEGAPLEVLCGEEEIRADWERIRDLAKRADRENWPFFMGYEWQGAGRDGDHNVFFLENDQPILHPLAYAELRDAYRGAQAIAVPHHLAYQLNSRGKNWSTHDPEFSPVAEIYSHHGSSENDTGPFDAERHLHMGPRTGDTCYERGLERGYRVGVIASGDNHNIPGVYDHGLACVLAEGSDKKSIWEALLARRTYGVTRSRMDIDFSVDGYPMGAAIPAGGGAMALRVAAADAIDRVEIVRDNVVEQVIVHSGTWERAPLPPVFKLKFAVEFGWGPREDIFGRIPPRKWHGRLRAPRRLLSVEKCWNNYGQRLYGLDENSCEFDLTTYMSPEAPKWMGPSPVRKEGFVFEVEAAEGDILQLEVDGEQIPLAVGDLLRSSRIIPWYRESVRLMSRVFANTDHYRDDLYWHNAYKVRVRQAVPESGYTLGALRGLDLPKGSNCRLRIWLRNGDAAWTSPIFCE